MQIVPVVFVWTWVDVPDAETGELVRRRAMVPHKRYDNLAGRQYSEGEEYPLVPVEERDMRSHNHYFAAIADSFENLPESIAARWPSPEHLRRWVLIECGYCDEKEIPCETRKDALAVMTFARAGDGFARISGPHKMADGTFVVIVRRAKSQSKAAMPHNDEFKRSKKAVLEYLDGLLGLAKGEVEKNARRRA